MIPDLGCDPKINILTIGASILQRLNTGPIEVEDFLVRLPKDLDVSMDHIILSADWLFTLNLIKISENMVVSHAAK